MFYVNHHNTTKKGALMTRINFDIDIKEHLALQNKVGKGNVSNVLKKYISHIITASEDEDLFLLQKRLDLIKEQKEKIDKEFFEVKSKIEGIEERERISELNKIKEQEKLKKEELRQAMLIDDAIGASGILEEFAERLD